MTVKDWKPRADGPPIPEAWDVKYTPTIMDGSVIRYKPSKDNQNEVSASRNAVCVYWSGGIGDGVSLSAAIARAQWDHERLKRKDEP